MVSSSNPGPSSSSTDVIGIAVNTSPSWNKVGNALSFASFSTAGLTLSTPLFFLQPNQVIHGIKIKHSQAFSGPSILSYTISVGIAGNLAKYASAFDVFQAVTSTAFQLSSNFVGEDTASPVQVLATATSTGANLNVVSTGLIDIWALLSVTQR